jgi:hypothetical protein
LQIEDDEMEFKGLFIGECDSKKCRPRDDAARRWLERTVYSTSSRNTPLRRLPVDEFNKSYGVKIVFFTVGYSTLRCEQLVLL